MVYVSDQNSVTSVLYSDLVRTIHELPASNDNSALVWQGGIPIYIWYVWYGTHGYSLYIVWCLFHPLNIPLSYLQLVGFSVYDMANCHTIYAYITYNFCLHACLANGRQIELLLISPNRNRSLSATILGEGNSYLRRHYISKFLLLWRPYCLSWNLMSFGRTD